MICTGWTSELHSVWTLQVIQCRTPSNTTVLHCIEYPVHFQKHWHWADGNLLWMFQELCDGQDSALVLSPELFFSICHVCNRVTYCREHVIVFQEPLLGLSKKNFEVGQKHCMFLFIIVDLFHTSHAEGYITNGRNICGDHWWNAIKKVPWRQSYWPEVHLGLAGSIRYVYSTSLALRCEYLCFLSPCASTDQALKCVAPSQTERWCVLRYIANIFIMSSYTNTYRCNFEF